MRHRTLLSVVVEPSVEDPLVLLPEHGVLALDEALLLDSLWVVLLASEVLMVVSSFALDVSSTIWSMSL